MEPQRKRIKTEHVELNRAEVKLEEEDGEEPEVVNIEEPEVVKLEEEDGEEPEVVNIEEPEVVNYNYAVKPKNALWVWPDVKVVDDEGYEYETVQFGDTERFQRILTESTSDEDLSCDLEWIEDEDRVEQRSDDGKWRRWPQEYCIEWEALPESKDSGIWWPSIDPRGSIRVREHWYCSINCIIASDYPWQRAIAADEWCPVQRYDRCPVTKQSILIQEPIPPHLVGTSFGNRCAQMYRESRERHEAALRREADPRTRVTRIEADDELIEDEEKEKNDAEKE